MTETDHMQETLDDLRFGFLELVLRVERGASLESLGTLRREFTDFIARAERFVLLHDSDGHA